MTELNIPRCRELIAELRDLPNDYIAYAEELCPEVADQLEAALAEVERLVKGIDAILYHYEEDTSSAALDTDNRFYSGREIILQKHPELSALLGDQPGGG